MNKKSFLFGAGILTIGALISRVLGAIYRVPLTRILGAVGMGMYQMVFPIYALLIVISTSGMPLAVSKLVASCQGNIYDKKYIINRSLKGIILFSLILSAILSIFCVKIAKIQGNADLSISYLSIAPAIIFVGIISVLRGYFQGEQNYTPTAVSQLVEQGVKIVVGLVLAFALKRYGIHYSVMGAILGVSVSEIVACFVLISQYGRAVRKLDYTNHATIHTKPKILSTMLPIIMCSIILPIANMVDSMIVVNILNKNFSLNYATAMYGIESGAVGAILNLPTVLSFALASTILPNIASQKDDSSRQTAITQALHINTSIILPCMLGLVLFAEPIISLLYGNSLDMVGLKGSMLATSILTVSGIGVLYMSFVQIFTAIMQGEGRGKTAVINLAIAVGVKYLVQIPLLFMPNVNIYGLVIGNLLCYTTAFILDYTSVKKYISLSSVSTARIVMSNILAFAVGVTLYNLLPNIYGFILAFIFILTIYFSLLFASKELNYLKIKLKTHK